MANSGVSATPTYCGLCETIGRPLFGVPDDRRLTDRAPRAVCRFCYLKLVGIAPKQRERVDAGAPRPMKAHTGIADTGSGA